MAGNYAKAGITAMLEIESKIFGAPKVDRPDVGWVEERKKICVGCDKTTWMTKKEYLEWLIANRKDIVEQLKGEKGIEEILLELPPLTIQQKDERRKQQFCSVCKCWLPAKMRVKDKQCPVGRWPQKADEAGNSVDSGANNGATAGQKGGSNV